MNHAKRIFLLTLIGTFCLAAVLGIWVVLYGSFLGVEEEVFGTLGTLFLFSLPGLMAASMWERRHWRGVNAAAMVICIIGTALFLFMVWFDPWQLFGGGPQEWLWKSMFVAAIWAWALPVAAGLGLTRFEGGLAAVRLGVIGTVYVLAASLSLLIVVEMDDDIAWRVMAVLGILVALGTLVTPILHVLFGAARPLPPEYTPPQVFLRCPRCLMEQTLAAGTSRCGRCRLRFTIDIEEPRCPKCRYLLHGLTRPVCPECGETLAPGEVSDAAGGNPAAAQRI